MQTHAAFQHNQYANADIESNWFIDPERIEHELQDSLSLIGCICNLKQQQAHTTDKEYRV